MSFGRIFAFVFLYLTKQIFRKYSVYTYELPLQSPGTFRVVPGAKFACNDRNLAVSKATEGHRQDILLTIECRA